MNKTVIEGAPAKPTPTLVFLLWVAQVFVATIFCYAAYLKLAIPIANLPAKGIQWSVEFPAWIVRALGAIDLAGGVGILLPSLTRIRPQLSVAAALGCTILQACAIIFHVSRGEGSLIGVNIALILSAAFVFWGRFRKAPIAPRG